MQIIKKDSTSMGFMGTLSVNMYEKYRRVTKRKSGALLNRTVEQRASISRVEICAFHCSILLFSGGIKLFHSNIKDITLFTTFESRRRHSVRRPEEWHNKERRWNSIFKVLEGVIGTTWFYVLLFGSSS